MVKKDDLRQIAEDIIGSMRLCKRTPEDRKDFKQGKKDGHKGEGPNGLSEAYIKGWATGSLEQKAKPRPNMQDALRPRFQRTLNFEPYPRVPRKGVEE